MIVYEVVQKYFDNGATKANLNPIESDTLPESSYEERKGYDIYKDYFSDINAARNFYQQALNA